MTARLSLGGALAVLMAGALLAPSALAGRVDPQHTRYRYFQDLSVTGPYAGEVNFAVLYKQNPKGIFTPREMVSYNLNTQVSCNPGGAAELSASGNAFSKYGYFRIPLTNGLFSHRFENQAENPQMALLKGSLGGTVVKRLKRDGRVVRTAQINGAFDVEDWDRNAGVQQNCIASGSFSATPCKRRMSPRSPNYAKWKRWQVPKCHQDPW